MTGGEIILRHLLSQGAGTAFGIPGALNAHLYDALTRVPEFRHVLVRNELGGAWMADGFARATNDVGVAFTVPGPGATHAASAIAGAYTDCSRLLLISSQSESALRGEFRRDLFHGLDQQRLFAPITKWSAAVRRAAELPEVLDEAFRRLRTGRPGPVQVEVPADVLGEQGGEFTPGPRITPPLRIAAETDLERAVAALRTAMRPLIMAGDGVLHSDGMAALGHVAAVLRAPVITSVMGKGALPHGHPWSLGDSNSPAGARAYAEHDLLLAVGERFTQVDTRWPWFFPPRRLVHLDADAREVGRVFEPEVGLVGDASRSLAALAERLVSESSDSPGWAASILEMARLPSPMSPILAALRSGLPAGTVMCFDVCLQGYLSRWEWPVSGPREWFYPGVYVGMGFGLPIGIGAKLARPGRPLCVVAGDGGFQMTMQELGTAAQLGIPLLVVVINDGGLTLIRRVQDRDFDGRRVEVDLRNPDFAALAAAYGIPSEAVTDEAALAEAAARGIAADGPYLIELRC